ncbi:hypothetical protein BHE74_00026460 [Ensete ventricosum]|nr:hypothetical protein BHE74_00026460 [Ensete ventricosum]
MLLLIGIPFPLRLRGRETRSRHLSSPKANLQALTLIALGAKESNTSTRSGPRTTQRRTQIYQPNTLLLPSRIPSRRRTRSVAPCPAELCNRRIRRRREPKRRKKRARGFGERGEEKERVGFPLLPMNSAAVTLSLFAHASRGTCCPTSTADAA